MDHVRESALPYYELLIDAGIIHLTAESAALKVNEVWDDVDAWWSSCQVQSAKNIFCGQYAKLSTNPIENLKNTILSLIDE